jgi:hypothetical protein
MAVENNDIEFEVGLINFKNDQTLNIKGLVVEFNVYEDIFSPVIKADFLLRDSVGLTERYPIVGDERVVLSFKSAGEKKSINLVLDVYKITQRTILEERSHGYVLHCVTREGIKNLISTEESAFVNQPIEDMVSKVYNTHIKPVGNKTLVVEPTNGIHSFISPRITPFEFISMLGSEAQSIEYPNTSTYVFYEDADQFNFRTISSMLKDDIAENFYLADPSDEKLRDSKEAIKPYQSIIGISFENQFDTVAGLNDGLFKNDVLSLDTILKKFTSTDFDYIRDFNNLYHSSKFPIISDVGTIGTTGTGKHERFLSTRITTKDYAKESYLDGVVTQTNDPQLSSPRRRQKFLNNSVSELQMFSQYTMNATVPGNSILRAGKLFNLFVPQNSDVNDDIQKYLMLFGQDNPTFLASAIKHNYKSTTGAYLTTMNVMKESFGGKIQSLYKSKDRSNES